MNNFMFCQFKAQMTTRTVRVAGIEKRKNRETIPHKIFLQKKEILERCVSFSICALCHLKV